MSDNVSCPDCNSQDIQEKVKQQITTTKVRNWKMFWLVLIIGFVVSVVSVIVMEYIAFFMFVGGIAVWGTIIACIIILRGSVKDKDLSYKFYVCRSCGREFRKS